MSGEGKNSRQSHAVAKGTSHESHCYSNAPLSDEGNKKCSQILRSGNTSACGKYEKNNFYLMALVLCGMKGSCIINKASDWLSGLIMKCIIVFEINCRLHGSHDK